MRFIAGFVRNFGIDHTHLPRKSVSSYHSATFKPQLPPFRTLEMPQSASFTSPHPLLFLHPKSHIPTLPRLRRINNTPLKPPHQLKEYLIQFHPRNILSQTLIFPMSKDQINCPLHFGQFLTFRLEPTLGSEEFGVVAEDGFVAVDAPGAVADVCTARDEDSV